MGEQNDLIYQSITLVFLFPRVNPAQGILKLLGIIYLLYAPPLHHVTCCCINRSQSVSHVDMPC